MLFLRNAPCKLAIFFLIRFGRLRRETKVSLNQFIRRVIIIVDHVIHAWQKSRRMFLFFALNTVDIVITVRYCP